MDNNSNLRDFLLDQLQHIVNSLDFSDPDAIPELQRAFNRLVDETDARLHGELNARSIQSDSIELTVVDEQTGRQHRRTLPVTFQETDNALRLIGETASGSPTEIVLFSGIAIDRIRDLTGTGPDSPRCQEE